VLHLGFGTYTYDGAATVEFCLPASEWKEVVKLNLLYICLPQTLLTM
jgi:hypothetical protein